MRDRAALERECIQLDGRSYAAYKSLRGTFAFDDITLYVDHVQGDPFATPSKLRVRMAMEVAGIPSSLISNRVRRIAMQDFVARVIRDAIPPITSHSGSGKSGIIRIDAGAQEVIERAAVRIHDDWIEARIEVGLPARGRRIKGHEARELLCETLPRVSCAGLRFASIDGLQAKAFVDCVENQEAIRRQLSEAGLVAFVGNGSLLPRESGASDRPLCTAGVVSFTAPPAFEVTFELPNPQPDGGQTIAGMGIRKGVTLIVGGGYHGKSTLLKALERGVYPHIPGDGREWVVSDCGLVKIRAEDGRRVAGTDIHAFIDALPAGADTHAFSTDDASGSTSQAASIIEAIEVGASGLLLDEDTCATNFMVRDARMQALVHHDFEPITPFVDHVAQLHALLGISSVLAMGGCGDYFEAADQVIMLRDYVPHDASAEAKQIARANPGERRHEIRHALEAPRPRVPVTKSFDASRGKRPLKIDVRGVDTLGYGRENIDLRGVAQLVDSSQTRAIGLAIHFASKQMMQPGKTLSEILDQLDALFDREGIETLDPYGTRGEHPGPLARPRRFEIDAAINRLRSLQIAH